MSDRVVRVVRTGGFAGMKRAGEVDLDADDERAAEAGELVQALDPDAVAALADAPTTGADRYVYDFDVVGVAFTVPEQHLSEDLRRLTVLVLEGP